jgi:hypothetical protein
MDGSDFVKTVMAMAMLAVSSLHSHAWSNLVYHDGRAKQTSDPDVQAAEKDLETITISLDLAVKPQKYVFRGLASDEGSNNKNKDREVYLSDIPLWMSVVKISKYTSPGKSGHTEGRDYNR